jgi:hypothetical protein
MSGTTNINDLHMDPTASSSNGNISMNANEISGGGAPVPISDPTNNISVSTNNNPGTPGINLDESTINQIVNGIQQASATGATKLNSRDIPTSTTQLTNDDQVKVNYIAPPTENIDSNYIEDYDNSDIIDNYLREKNNESRIDSIIEMIKTPAILAILYFIFQMPLLKNIIIKHIYKGFINDDRNFNFNGNVFLSVLFGFSYFGINELINIINNF